MKPDDAAIIKTLVDYGRGEALFHHHELQPIALAAADRLRALLAGYEDLKEKQAGWVSVDDSMPKPGEIVEIAQFELGGKYKAVYEPEQNQFLPWRIVDYMLPGLWHRAAEAVTHWRRGPGPGGEGSK